MTPEVFPLVVIIDQPYASTANSCHFIIEDQFITLEPSCIMWHNIICIVLFSAIMITDQVSDNVHK